MTLKINRVPDSPKYYVPSLVKIHWRMLILVFTRMLRSKDLILTFDLWSWKSIGFQTLLWTKYVPSSVKIHWRMLILECSQGCYAVKTLTLTFDLRPWKSVGFQTLLRTKYLPGVVKIHWRMLILECSQGCYGRKDGRKERRTVALLYPFAISLARG